MKKFLSFLAVPVLAFSISCGDDSSDKKTPTNSAQNLSSSQQLSFQAAMTAVFGAMDFGMSGGSYAAPVKCGTHILRTKAKGSADDTEITIDYSANGLTITGSGRFVEINGSYYMVTVTPLTITFNNYSETYVDETGSHTTSITGSATSSVAFDSNGNGTDIITADFTNITVDGQSSSLGYSLTIYDDYTAGTEHITGTITFGETTFTIDETDPIEPDGEEM